MRRGNQTIEQLLVQWDGGMSPTWEDKEDLRALHPKLDLEDKVSFNGGGVVTDPGMPGPANDEQGPNREHEAGRVRRSQRIKKKTWKLRDLEDE